MRRGRTAHARRIGVADGHPLCTGSAGASQGRALVGDGRAVPESAAEQDRAWSAGMVAPLPCTRTAGRCRPTDRCPAVRGRPRRYRRSGGAAGDRVRGARGPAGGRGCPVSTPPPAGSATVTGSGSSAGLAEAVAAGQSALQAAARRRRRSPGGDPGLLCGDGTAPGAGRARPGPMRTRPANTCGGPATRVCCGASSPARC